MLPDFGLDWMDGVDHAFLIRAPERVVARLRRAARGGDARRTSASTGRPSSSIAWRSGRHGAAGRRRRGGPRRSGGRAAPALRRARARLRRPHAGLAGRSARERRGLGGALVCGRERSTGFAPPEPEPPPPSGRMRAIAEAARADYDRLNRHAGRACRGYAERSAGGADSGLPARGRSRVEALAAPERVRPRVSHRQRCPHAGSDHRSAHCRREVARGSRERSRAPDSHAR